MFRGRQESYWHICFKDGSERDYHERDLHIAESCLNDKRSADVFQYIKQIAELSNIRNEETGENYYLKDLIKLLMLVMRLH